MKCPDCSKENWVVVREKAVVETRFIDLEDGSSGQKKYTGSWRKEQDLKEKIVGIRCNSCDKKLTDKDLEKYEVKMEKVNAKTGVLFVGTALEKFFN
jgi:uncharacterized OB-fold protein